VKLEPIAGQANLYDLTRADQPTQEGTPLNKANLLSDATAAAIKALLASQTEDPATPNDALNILAQAVDAAATKADVVDSKGNCEIYYGSYVGNYSNTSTTMTFPHKPIAVMVCGRRSKSMFAWRGQEYAPLLPTSNSSVKVSWADRSATWENGDNNNDLNWTGFTHKVIALLDAEE
jgi:hypothetical protein